MIIGFIEIENSEVGFYFLEDEEYGPIYSYQLKKGSKTQKRLRRLEEKILRWNNRNPVAIRTIHLTSGGAIFQRSASIGSFDDVHVNLHGAYFQNRLDRMERILRRWNKRNRNY